MTTKAITALSAACLIACAAVASAQTSTDRSFKAVSKQCSGIEWSEKALSTYPTITAACQGVTERDGKTYVKFQGTISKNVNHGQQLVVNFKDGGQVTLSPPADMNVYVHGQKTSVGKLARGDEEHFYVAEDRLAAQFADSPDPEPEITTTRFIIVPIVVHEPERTASLPATSSNWPLVALSGFMMLGFGGLLRWSRRRR